MRLPTSCQQMLIERGIVPPGCSNVELHIPAHGALMLRYDVFINGELLDALASVLRAAAASVSGLDEPEK